MSEEFKPGDRVAWNQGAGDTYIVEPLKGYMVRVRNERTGESWFPRRQDLTRIEPAVPQPKFCVGQVVSISKSGYRRVVKGVTVESVYGLEGVGDFTWREDELEAVPEACPTCGQEVRDG